jgi:hypothetical protein
MTFAPDTVEYCLITARGFTASPAGDALTAPNGCHVSCPVSIVDGHVNVTGPDGNDVEDVRVPVFPETAPGAVAVFVAMATRKAADIMRARR